MSIVNVDVEHVMVVPTQLFHDCGYFQGFNSEIDRFLPILLDNDNTEYLPRDAMEENPDYKQLIPYCILQHTDSKGETQIFQYCRGRGQGEKRLHAKRSIGIGGHISTLDLTDDSPYDVGMQRELVEEVVIDSNFQQHCVGLINDDETDVGKVHLGVVHIFKLDQPNVSANEADLVDARFWPVSELHQQIGEFETWSQICLRALY